MRIPSKEFIMQPQVHMQATLDGLWKDFVAWLLVQIDATLKNQDYFHWAIPGGSTPESLFRFLAGPEGDSIPWNRIHFWWTDERYVPIADVRSNYRMAFDALLQPRKIPDEQIHRVKTEFPEHRSAVLYAIELEDTLCRRFTSIPFFDLVLLGVGEDGHVASLFPHGSVEEPHPWSVIAKHDGVTRISLPYEVIGASSRIAFLATGKRKQEILKRVFRPLSGADEDLPVAILCRRRPDHVWFMDSAAGISLENR
jgi:6-phosphogluconolactonase